MPEFLTEYTHIDGTRWTGPSMFASSPDEAVALAMDYPVQPLRVVGEVLDTHELPNEIVRDIRYLPDYDGFDD